MRRGFTSLHGAFLAISWDTGKVIDYEVLSRHCQQCTIFQRKLSKHEISKEQYTANVRGHGNDLQGMACAIWASVVHCVSTDDKPQHQFCPLDQIVGASGRVIKLVALNTNIRRACRMQSSKSSSLCTCG